MEAEATPQLGQGKKIVEFDVNQKPQSVTISSGIKQSRKFNKVFHLSQHWFITKIVVKVC